MAASAALLALALAAQASAMAQSPQTQPAPVRKPAANPAAPAGVPTSPSSPVTPGPLTSPRPGGSTPAGASPSPGLSSGASRTGGKLTAFHEVRTLRRPLVFAALTAASAENAALALSPDVAGARSRLLQSQYVLAGARSGIAPSFIANYVQAPQGNPPGPNIISRQVTTGIQLTIGDFLAYSPAVREAAFGYAAAQADLAAAVITERVKVVGFYFDALKARAVAFARRDALTLATAQLRAAQVRANSGDVPQLDVVRAEVAAAKATADAETSTAGDLNALEALAIETTTPAKTLAVTTPTEFVAIDPKFTDPETVVALARARRPELISARLAASGARSAIRSAQAAGFPLLTVSGGYLVGTDSGVPINAPTINAQLTVPLGTVNRNKVRVAEARAFEAQTKAGAIERQVTLDVASSARTLGASGRAAVATTRARQAAETELRATQIGYQTGASSSFEVAFARQSYSQAVVDELSALYDLEKARATLDIQLGL